MSAKHLGVALMCLALASVAAAASPALGAPRTITACFAVSQYAPLTLSVDGGLCRPAFRRVEWDARGWQGDRGPRGVRGATVAPGPAGPAGATGQQGPGTSIYAKVNDSGTATIPPGYSSNVSGVTRNGTGVYIITVSRAGGTQGCIPQATADWIGQPRVANVNIQSEAGGQYAVAVYELYYSPPSLVNGDFWFTMVCPQS